MVERVGVNKTHAFGARLRWELQYRWSGLAAFDRLLLLVGVAMLVLFLALQRQLDQEQAALRQQLFASRPTQRAVVVAPVDASRAVLGRFQQFLPEPASQRQVWADVHRRADAAGIVIDRVALTNASCDYGVCWHHGMGLLLTARREVAERFLLELLRSYPSLALDGMAFHLDSSNEALLSVELKLDYLTRPL